MFPAVQCKGYNGLHYSTGVILCRHDFAQNAGTIFDYLTVSCGFMNQLGCESRIINGRDDSAFMEKALAVYLKNM